MDWALIDRELARRERSRRTYWLRFAIGGVAFGYLALIGASIVLGSELVPERIGDSLTSIGQTFQLGAALLLPVLLTADLVAREKQERTLGLLLLADSSGFGVYGAKFLSAFLPCALMVLGALPVLAIGAPFGGIEVGALVVQTLLLLATTFAATAIGMQASIRAWQPGPAFFFAGAVVLGLSVAPVRLNPVAMAWRTGATGVEADWWVSFLVTIALGLVVVVQGWRVLPRMAFDKPVPRRRLRQVLRNRQTMARRRTPRDAAESILARRMGGWSSAIRPGPLRAVAALLLAAVAFLPCLGGIFLVAVIAHDVLSSLRAGKESGAIDDVRLAAYDREALARWIYRGQARRCMFYLPAMIVGGGLGFSGMVLLDIVEPWTYGRTPRLDDIPPIGILFLGISIAAIAQIRLAVALSCFQFVRSRSFGWRDVSMVVWTYVLYLAILILILGYVGVTVGLMMSDLSRQLPPRWGAGLRYMSVISYFGLIVFFLWGTAHLCYRSFSETLESFEDLRA